MDQVRHLCAMGICSCIPRKKSRVIISVTDVVREGDTLLYLASDGVPKSVRPVIENGDLDRFPDHCGVPCLERRAVLGRHELVKKSMTILKIIENLETAET